MQQSTNPPTVELSDRCVCLGCQFPRSLQTWGYCRFCSFHWERLPKRITIPIVQIARTMPGDPIPAADMSKRYRLMTAKGILFVADVEGKYPPLPGGVNPVWFLSRILKGDRHRERASLTPEDLEKLDRA